MSFKIGQETTVTGEVVSVELGRENSDRWVDVTIRVKVGNKMEQFAAANLARDKAQGLPGWVAGETP